MPICLPPHPSVDLLLTCPISGDGFCDPVLAGDGWTYQRDALEGWVKRHGARSPRTGEAMAAAVVTNDVIRRICRERREMAAANRPALDSEWERNLDCPVTYERMVQPIRLSDGFDYDLATLPRILTLPNGSPFLGRAFAPSGAFFPDRTLQALSRATGAAVADYPCFVDRRPRPSFLWPMTAPPVADRATHERVSAYLDPLLAIVRQGQNVSYDALRRPSGESLAFRRLSFFHMQTFLAQSAEAMREAAADIVTQEERLRGVPFLLAGPWTSSQRFWALHAAEVNYLNAKDLCVRALTPLQGRRLRTLHKPFGEAVVQFNDARHVAHYHNLSIWKLSVSILGSWSISQMLLSSIEMEPRWQTLGTSTSMAVTTLAVHLIHRASDILTAPTPHLDDDPTGISLPWWHGWQVTSPLLRRVLVGVKSAALWGLAGNGAHRMMVSAFGVDHSAFSIGVWCWLFAVPGGLSTPPRLRVSLPPELLASLQAAQNALEAMNAAFGVGPEQVDEEEVFG